LIYAQKKGLSLGLITNGQMIRQNTVERLVKTFTWIRLSINASTPKGYKLIHGVDEKEFNRTWKNAELICSARDKYNQKCFIGAKFLTDRNRVSEMSLFAQKAKKAGFNYCEFKPFHERTVDVRNVIQEIRAKYQDETFKVISVDQDYENMVSRYDKKAEYDQPYAYNFRCVITTDFDVYPNCFTRSISKFKYGNLLEQNFEEIWFSDKKRTILSSLLKQSDCPSQCYKENSHLFLQKLKEEYKQKGMSGVEHYFVENNGAKDAHLDFVG
jgi:MoaA/NifB/PqqE/SkfB family radical SAM enzyme